MTESENDFYPFVENIGDTNPEIECQIVSERLVYILNSKTHLIE